MWIERDCICTIETAKEWPFRFVERGEGAICAVNVEPEIEFVGDVSNLIEPINCAGVDSPSAADNAKRF